MEEENRPAHWFKKGNQLAKGNPTSGRNPIYFTDEEAEEIGKELVQWMKDLIASGKPPVHFVQFYNLKKGLFLRDWDLLCCRKVFSPYYESARDLMALATQLNDKLSTAYGSRFLGVYSRDLRAHERAIQKEKLADELELKKAEMSSFTPEVLELNKSILDGITSRQKEAQERKTEDIINKNL